jgi:salicylate hydroxylase
LRATQAQETKLEKPINDLPILIAGGGIGGLACALALAKRGVRSVVLEQASAFSEIGVGLQIAPNALTVLDKLGVGHLVKKDALLIERLLIRDGVSGDSICDLPCDQAFLERFGNPYALGHRADILEALLVGCRAESGLIGLRTKAKLAGFTEDADRVRVTLASGEVVEGSGLIGADGVHSTARQLLYNDGGPVSVGAIIFRVLIPADQMPLDKHHDYPTLWAGPGGHIIYYPLRERTTFNVGVTVNTDMTGITEGTATVEEVFRYLDGWTPEATDFLKIPKEFMRYIIRHRLPLEHWSRGRVTLLGDAAHGMVQYLAQGAAMALEDAMCLADQIARHGAGAAGAAFKAYEDLRIARATRVQSSSLLMDKIYHVRGVERLARNSIFEGRTQAQYLDRMAWLWEAPPYVRNFP